MIIECDTLSACLAESVYLDNRSLRIQLTDLNKLIWMFPEKNKSNSFVYMTIFCFYGTDHELFISWKQFSLALKDEQIKKFTRQREFPHHHWRADD